MREDKSTDGRRVRRMSDDETSSYRETRKRREEGAEPGAEREFRPARAPRPERENNVNLYLSPRLMDLAGELADQAKMPLKLYLVEEIKYVLLAKAGRLEKKEK